ncbi:MAG: imidazole glycerol phosphate synthase subunit HisH [Alteromonadales bacterium]|nr:imidazole glycerol phosphate synthase subunit HisH [Alteromonadales bacterium]
MVIVLDYGVGNLGSVLNMLKKVGANCKISNSPAEIMSAKKIILPGVGSFDHGMEKLKESGLDKLLIEKSNDNNCQIMGICLGMQLLTEGSEEGKLPGLGLISGRVKKFDSKLYGDLKIPHMGWNIVTPKKSHYLLENLPEESRYYFVHSYYVSCNNSTDILMTTEYGSEFVSAFQKNNIIGCQFHPEKSHSFGIQLFRNFVKQREQEHIC